MSTRGKVAIVTGSSSGIGRAIVRRLAAAGWAVVVNSRNIRASERVANSIVAAGGQAVAVVADVTKERDAERLVAAAVQSFGALDLLVNNAGVGDVTPSDALPLVSWQMVLDTNLTAAFLCSRAAAPHMLDQGGRIIVNISSVLGHAGLPGRAAYSASKAGLSGLTRALAVEWGPRGVRVVTVSPGYVATEMVRERVEEGALAVDNVEIRVPSRRLGQPDEVAAVVAFVASPGGSYVNGAETVVDGGLQAHLGI